MKQTFVCLNLQTYAVASCRCPHRCQENYMHVRRKWAHGRHATLTLKKGKMKTKNLGDRANNQNYNHLETNLCASAIWLCSPHHNDNEYSSPFILISFSFVHKTKDTWGIAGNCEVFNLLFVLENKKVKTRKQAREQAGIEATIFNKHLPQPLLLNNTWNRSCWKKKINK